MLPARDERREDDEGDESPDEQAEIEPRLHARDDLSDQERLDERRPRAQDAEDDDDRERALVLEEVRKQLGEGRTRTLVGLAAPGAAATRPGREGAVAGAGASSRSAEGMGVPRS